VAIGADVADGLAYAHAHGIVHRDIKPANIMVVSGTNIKVADFGAAFLKSGMEPQFQEMGVGSPYYMSPEQINGQDLGHQSDMFSMGVVLYELFTGKRPFTAESLPELFNKILNDQPALPSTLRTGLSTEIDRILLMMLGKTPADRYPGWADLALDIAKIGRLSVYQKGIPDSDRFTALRKVSLLERLNDAEIWELVHAGRWSRIPPQQAIVKEGDPGKSLFFIGSGQAKVTKAGRLLSVLSASECFGEMAYVKSGGMPRSATVETIADTVLAEFEPEMLEKVSINCQLQLTAALLHAMVDRLAIANERLSRAPQ
jgi:serine/threonine protein kinase